MDNREFRLERRRQNISLAKWIVSFFLGTMGLGILGYYIQYTRIQVEKERSARELQIDYFETFLPHYLNESRASIDRQLLLLEYMSVMSNEEMKSKYQILIDSVSKRKSEIDLVLDSLSKVLGEKETEIDQLNRDIRKLSSTNATNSQKIDELQVQLSTTKKEARSTLSNIKQITNDPFMGNLLPTVVKPYSFEILNIEKGEAKKMLLTVVPSSNIGSSNFNINGELDIQPVLVDDAIAFTVNNRFSTLALLAGEETIITSENSNRYAIRVDSIKEEVYKHETKLGIRLLTQTYYLVAITVRSD